MTDLNLNTAWSQLIQSPKTLDYFRLLRFQDYRQSEIINAFSLKPGSVIADIGCGPGTLSLKLAKWLTDSTEVIGIDRDTNFIEYAKCKAAENQLSNVAYHAGDALNLFLPDNSVDHAISYTVIEHLPHELFLREQIRICKKGGRITIGFVRTDRGFSRSSGTRQIPGTREMELWSKLAADSSENDKKLHIAAYTPNEIELIALMEQLGLTDIEFNVLALPVFPDDARLSSDTKTELLSMEYAQNIESAAIQQALGKKLSTEEFAELNELLKIRFATKSESLKLGIKTRDFSVGISVIITGMVNK